MNEQIAKFKTPIIFLLIGVFLGGISTYTVTNRALELEKERFYDGVRNDMANVRDKILKKDNPSFRDIEKPVLGVHEINDKYLKSFTILKTTSNSDYNECVVRLENEFEYGRVSPNYEVVFYDEYGKKVFEVGDYWILETLGAGFGDTKSKEFYIRDINSLRYYTSSVY